MSGNLAMAMSSSTLPDSAPTPPVELTPALLLATVAKLEEGIIIIRRDGHVLLANPEAARNLCVSPEKLSPGTNFRHLLTQLAPRYDLTAERFETLLGLDPKTWNLPRKRRFALTLNAQAEQGQDILSKPLTPDCLLISLRSLTKDQLAKEKIESARALLSGAMESLPLAIALWGQKQQLLIHNERFRALLAPVQELLRTGAQFPELMYAFLSSDSFRDKNSNEELIESCLELYDQGQGHLELHTRQGRHLLFSARHMTDHGVITIWQDATDLKLLEQRLLDAIESTHESFAFFDRNLKLLLCNSTCKILFPHHRALMNPGTSYQQLKDGQLWVNEQEKNAEQAVWLPSIPSVNFTQDRRLRDGRWIMETHHWTGEGNLVITQTNISALKNKEYELTELAQNYEIEKQRAESASEAKSSFLAVMSHEIRTPLNGIIGMATLLLETQLSPEQQHYTQALNNSSHLLTGLINQVLDFSKIEAGHVELDFVPFNLEDMLCAVVELFGANAEQIGLNLVATIGRDLPEYVIGDLVRIRQILLNLVGNALKFTEWGGVAINLSLEPPASTDDQDTSAEIPRDVRAIDSKALPLMIRISVIDSGIGIESEKQDSLFQAFTQADSSTTRRFGGTGLGLALCKKLAVCMGGGVGITSSPGEGSTFWATLQFYQAPNPPAAPEVALLDRHLKGRRCAVIDPCDVSRRAFAHQLEIHGAQVFELRQGNDLIRAIAPQNIAPQEKDQLALPIPDYIFHVVASHQEQSSAPMLRATGARFLILITQPGEHSSPNAANGSENPYDGTLVKPLRRRALAQMLCQLHKEEPSDHSAQKAPTLLAAKSPTVAQKILLVEDNKVNQLFASTLLRKHNHEITLAQNGQEALDIIEKSHAGDFDLILMDMQMPVMDGLQATRAIRRLSRLSRRNKSGAEIPIIAMTANAMRTDREACIAAGMNDYISKPIDVQQLLNKLSRWGRVDGPTPALPPTPIVETQIQPTNARQKADDQAALAELLDSLGDDRLGDDRLGDDRLGDEF